MAKAKRRSLREGELVAMIARKYPDPGYACIPQLRSATGQGLVRTADAAVFSLWPSRGLEIWGFECKSARSDWLKELASPGKADEIQKYCHRWYIVTGTPDIVQDGELPRTWGLMVPAKNGQGLSIKKAAPLLKARAPSLSLVCSIMRRLSTCSIDMETHRQDVDEARKRAFERGQEEAGPAGESRYKEQYEELKAHVDRFEEDSGVDLDGWSWREAAEAVKLLADHIYRDNSITRLQRHESALDSALTEARRCLKELKEAEKLMAKGK